MGGEYCLIEKAVYDFPSHCRSRLRVGRCNVLKSNVL